MTFFIYPSNMSRSYDSSEPSSSKTKLLMTGGIALCVGAGVGFFVLSRFRTASPHEILVRTGWLVKESQISRQFIRWPFQWVKAIPLEPKPYEMNFEAMTSESLKFKFPGSLVIGPDTSNDGLRRYATQMLHLEPSQQHMIIKNVCDGEARSLAAGLTMKQIFEGRHDFKLRMMEAVGSEFEKLGLKVITFNVRELLDHEGSNYFGTLSQRIQAEATNKAIVDVAEQDKIGATGAKQREAEKRRNVAMAEADAVLAENERQQRILESNALLAQTKAEQAFIEQSAQIRAVNDAEKLKQEREREVQEKRLAAETERARATELSKVRVLAEIAKARAEGEANAVRVTADANRYKAEQDSQALYMLKEREAAGQRAILEAQASGVEKLLTTLGGNSQALISYLMVDRGLYSELAKANAEAIRGLNPKITVWTNDANNAYDSVKQLGKSVVPMLQTIHDQTGFKLPDWVVQTPQGVTKTSEESSDHIKQFSNLVKSKVIGNLS